MLTELAKGLEVVAAVHQPLATAFSDSPPWDAHDGGRGGFVGVVSFHGGGGGCPSATVIPSRSTEVAPATASRPTARTVTTSKRFMFFLQVDLTGGCIDTAPTRRCSKTTLMCMKFF